MVVHLTQRLQAQKQTVGLQQFLAQFLYRYLTRQDGYIIIYLALVSCEHQSLNISVPKSHLRIDRNSMFPPTNFSRFHHRYLTCPDNGSVGISRPETPHMVSFRVVLMTVFIDCCSFVTCLLRTPILSPVPKISIYVHE